MELPERRPARSRGVEMSGDPEFARRVVRLAVTSIVALGVIFLLGVVTGAGAGWIGLALALGWVLMPALLFLSLDTPGLRYALVAPATLVGLALVAICAGRPDLSPAARAGWLMTTAGVLLGGVMGAWLWFRLLPVPFCLRDPFGSARWALIATHVALIVFGMVLVALSLLG